MPISASSWQQALAQGFAKASELLAYLKLPTELASNQAELEFKTRVPRAFADRMQPGNPRDPLLLQVLASPEELAVAADFSLDPLKEQQANPVEGLLHKYPGRVLLTLTGACAINCRYCFRRHFPYQDNNPGIAGWEKAIAYIAQDPSIYEVILSGGDPLLAKDAVLLSVLEKIAAIPHVKILRIHSRIPVVLPERINESLLSYLKNIPLQKVLVLHCNHPQELGPAAADACAALAGAGVQLLNQSVLLAGVNDSVEVLRSLSLRLFSLGVLPYYLHLLDKVQAAAHFDLPREQALTLFHGLQQSLPGYLVPRLVTEEPGQRSKTLVLV